MAATVPGVVPSSGSSEAGSEGEFSGIGERCSSPVFDMLLREGMAGDASPGTICRQRSLSTALVSDLSMHHELLDGRMTRLCVNGTDSTLLPKPPPNIGTLFRSSTVSNQSCYGEMTNNPPSLRLDAWSESFAHNFMVRSATYLYDSIKVPSESSLFRLLTVDLVSSDRPNFQGLCSHPSERIQLALKREQETGTKQLPPFVFAVNLCVPASAGTGRSPAKNTTASTSSSKSSACYHLVAYFGIENIAMITSDHESTAIGRLCNRFFFGECDKFRDATFKLIPRITEGNFVVRKAVGSKPSILGKKLKQYYVRTDRFMELIVDIGSDGVATRIVKLALGYAKTLTVDMMFLLEGATSDTLPERVLAGMRVKEIDFKSKDGQRTMDRS
jgi:Protein ENHANCED DISEASE RESISTANCE 2, C-terminal